jgi:hypothetical protein
MELPESVKRVSYTGTCWVATDTQRSITHIRDNSQMCNTRFHDGITHVKLGMRYKYPPIIPHSVTHLKISFTPKQRLVYPYVTHLKFGKHYTGSIKNHDMSSVTHLKFHPQYKERIKWCVPRSVIYLEYQGYVITGTRLEEYYVSGPLKN